METMVFQTVTRNKRLRPAVEAGGWGNLGVRFTVLTEAELVIGQKFGESSSGVEPSPQFSSSSPFLQHFFPPLAPREEGGRVGGFKMPPENDDLGSCSLTTAFSVSSSIKLGGGHTSLRGLLQNRHMWMSGPIHCKPGENKWDSSPTARR